MQEFDNIGELIRFIEYADTPRSITNELIAKILEILHSELETASDNAQTALLRIQTLTSQDLSSEIDNVQEVLAFLKGIRDDEVLLSKLSDIVQKIEAVEKKATDNTTALSSKVDKVEGKGLSANDFSDSLKTKLDGIAEGANNYTHPSTHPATMISEDATHRFMTDTERNKLNGIAEGANNYTHPSTHSATMITEDATHRFMTDAERNKLRNINEAGILSEEQSQALARLLARGMEVLPVDDTNYTLPAAGQKIANGILFVKNVPYSYFIVNDLDSDYKDEDYNTYVAYMGGSVPCARADKLYMHGGNLYLLDSSTKAELVRVLTMRDGGSGGVAPGGGTLASEITTDPQHQFITSDERKKWNTPEILPFDGICDSRAAMPQDGVWAFPEDNGMWTVDGNFASYGLSRGDYALQGGTDGYWYPKPDAVFRCVSRDHSCPRFYVVGAAEESYRVMPLTVNDGSSAPKIWEVTADSSGVNLSDNNHSLQIGGNLWEKFDGMHLGDIVSLTITGNADDDFIQSVQGKYIITAENGEGSTRSVGFEIVNSSAIGLDQCYHAGIIRTSGGPSGMALVLSYASVL